MKCNDNGLKIIKQFEGLRLRSYQDIGAKWTIGYGHTAYVCPGQVITQEQADLLLWGDLNLFCQQLDSILKTDSLTGNEYSALICLLFNVGIGNLRGSTLIRYVNQGKKDLAANEFLCWNHCDGKVDPGLTRRRQAERELFLEPINKIV